MRYSGVDSTTLPKKHAHNANRDSPLLFHEIEQENDEELSGIIDWTTSDRID
jgi:hypothetical protein